MITNNVSVVPIHPTGSTWCLELFTPKLIAYVRAVRAVRAVCAVCAVCAVRDALCLLSPPSTVAIS